MTDAILNMVRGMQLGQHFEEILKAFLFDAFACIVMEFYLGGVDGSEEGEVHVKVRQVVPVSEELLLLVLAPRLGQTLPQLHAHRV